MVRSTVLAFGAGAAGVIGAWEALAAVEGTRASAALARVLEPIVRAGREGRAATPPERRRLALLSAGALLAAGWLVAGPAAGVVAGLTGPAIALAALRARRRRYGEDLRHGAGGAARALADALAAGHSIRGAVVEVAGALPGAAGHELRQAGHALALGEPTEPVLERLRRRARCSAWDTMVAAILLQRDAGGDLAGLLRELAASLEAAERIERDARAATAQARFTAWLVLVLPIGAALLAELGSPGFITSLVTHPVSAWLAGLAAILQGIAVICVRRLARPRELA
jgi:tight adherence protein B